MIPINGKLVSATDAAAAFESGTAAAHDVTAAHARLLQAVAAARSTEAAVARLIHPIKSFVQNAFGEHSNTAASFGFKPRKPRHVSVEARYEGVEKLRATRAARDAVLRAGSASN